MIKDDSDPSNGKNEPGAKASADRTIRFSDLKLRNSANAGKDATPPIKVIKTVFVAASRPAPEIATDIPRSTRIAPPQAASMRPDKLDSSSVIETDKPSLTTGLSANVKTISKSPRRPVAAVGALIPAPVIRLGAKLNAATLPAAVGQLFELNNYSVRYGDKVHGAEIDIIATPKGDPFGATVYIEVTVQYVDNTKYGKDLTKFALLREKDKQATCICVSTDGFTPDVRERAHETRILLRTYDQLFSQFEKFSPYVDSTLARAELISLVQSYEEPSFRDEKGEHPVTEWLNSWKSNPEASSNWLVVLGEYGTGKTALTLKMHHDWLVEYRNSPQHPIPIRIELRNFSRQFDSRSLLHYFLDSNSLGHISIEFLLYLIRNQRVILILDGYDEMAQFLNARERRACLAALADLAGEGAKGILTSRPNYFTESEELHVFDALYASIEQNNYFVGQIDRLFVAQEQSIDKLLDRYLINKNERYLRDLSREQTKALIRRKLSDNPKGQEIVIGLLEKVFREEGEGKRQSLSGKPVIISYLLELVDYLVSDSPDPAVSTFNEWQIYKLIVDRLMWRDLQRSPMMPMERRRAALQRLAVTLSGKSVVGASEELFFSIIDDLFRSDLRRLSPEEQRSRRDELFQDLRSSATLTRSESGNPSVWYFSHNSLREFLVAEFAVGALHTREPLDMSFPISSAMRSFVTALPVVLANNYREALRDLWPKRAAHKLGGSVCLAFDLLRSNVQGLGSSIAWITRTPEGRLELSDISLKEIEFNAGDLGNRVQFVCNNSVFTEVTFRGLDMSESNFQGATFDRCSFIDCILDESDLSSTLIFECNFNQVAVTGCNFKELDSDSNIMAATSDGNPILLSGRNAIGYFKYHGANTDEVTAYYELQNDPRFSIVIKIFEHIYEQKNSQLRGLTQRGVAQSDTPFARRLIEVLQRSGLIEVDQKELVSATNEGRRQIPRLLNHAELPAEIEALLRA